MATEFFVLYPGEQHPPNTGNRAALEERNAHDVIAYDDTTDEDAVWEFELPKVYAGSGLTIDIGWSHAASTGNVQWSVACERIGTAQVVTTDSFAAANTVDDQAVPGTIGFVKESTITFTNGADMDSWAAGELGRIKVGKRDATTSAATGDTYLHFIRVSET